MVSLTIAGQYEYFEPEKLPIQANGKELIIEEKFHDQEYQNKKQRSRRQEEYEVEYYDYEYYESGDVQKYAEKLLDQEYQTIRQLKKRSAECKSYPCYSTSKPPPPPKSYDGYGSVGGPAVSPA